LQLRLPQYADFAIEREGYLLLPIVELMGFTQKSCLSFVLRVFGFREQ
jgi:hypothetical protein